MMKLIDYTVKGFTEELASSSPAPGGGSTAAIEGAFGAGLVAMVCELTLGNKKYEEFHESANAIKDEANTYRERLLEIVDEDTEAFNLVSAAFAMKKETEEEKQLRREAIQNGLKQCCVPPLDVMRNVFETLKLAQKLIDSYNTSTASDLGTGIVSLRSALQGAYFNVLINAGSIKDEQYVSEKKTEAETIRNEFELLYDSLYQKILEELTR